MPKRRQRGSGTVYQRKDKKFVAQAFVLSGQRRSWVADTELEALQRMTDALARDRQGLPVEPANRTLGNWLDEWLAARHLQPRTREMYRTRLLHVKERIGGRVIGRVNHRDIGGMYSTLLEQHASPATIRAIHQVLSSAFKAAVDDGMIPTNPCRRVELPAIPKTPNRTLTVEQIARLVQTEPDPMWKALWALMGTTGVRVGEATALTWERVHVETRKVDIHHTLTRPPGGGWQLGPTKTRASYRTVSVPAWAMDLLREWRDAPHGVVSHLRLVFTNRRGDALHNNSVNMAFKAALYRADLPKIRLHDLRHSAATILLSGGEYLNVVSEMLGHGDVGITLGIYGHVMPAMHEQAMSRLDALYKEASGGVKQPTYAVSAPEPLDIRRKDANNG